MKPKRLLKFNLRTLMALTALVAISIVSFGFLKSRATARSNAFIKIKEHGGNFLLMAEPNSIYRTVMLNSGVDERAFWKTNCFRFGPHVDDYDFDNPMDNRKLEILAPYFERVSTIEILTFTDCDLLTDEGLKHLPASLDLKQIVLDGTNVTEEGVKFLKTRYPGIQVKHNELLRKRE